MRSYVNKTDVRFSKVVRVGAYRLTGGLDIFNVLNSSDVLAVNTTVGTSWLNPTQVLGGQAVPPVSENGLLESQAQSEVVRRKSGRTSQVGHSRKSDCSCQSAT